MGGGFLTAEEFIKQFGLSEMVRMQTKGRIDLKKSTEMRRTGISTRSMNRKKTVAMGELK